MTSFKKTGKNDTHLVISSDLFESVPHKCKNELCSLTEEFPEPVIAIDINGIIVDCNRATAILHNLTRDKIIDKSFIQLMNLNEKEANPFFKLINDVISKKVAPPINLSIKSNGKARHLEIFPSLFRSTKNTPAIQMITRDITKEVKTGKIRRLMTDIYNASNKPGTLIDLIEYIHYRLESIVEVTNFFVALYDDNTDKYTFPYRVDQFDQNIRIPDGSMRKSLTEYIRKSGISVRLTSDKMDELQEQGVIKRIGSHAKVWMGAPLKMAGKVFGVVAIQNFENEYAYSDEDLDLLVRSTEYIAQAIERKKAEEELRRSEEKFRTIFEKANDIIIVINKSGKIVDLNKKEVFGYKRNEIINKRFSDLSFFAGNSVELMIKDFKNLLSEKIPFAIREFCLIDINGETFYVEAVTQLLKRKDNVKGVLSIIRDVTDRKKTELALIESEQINRAILEHSPIGVSVRNRYGKLISVNNAWKNIWSITDDDFDLDKTFERATFNFNERDNYLGIWQSKVKDIYRKGGYLYIPELKLLKEKNKDRWISHHFYAIKNNEDQVDRIVILTEDITERKLSQNALMESEERFRTIFETARDSIFMKDREFRYTQVNPAMVQLFGTSAEDLLGKSDGDLFGQESARHITEIDKRVLAGEIIDEIDHRPIGKGQERYFHIIKVPIRNQRSEIVGLCGIARDVTDQQALEEELIRTEKLESIGILAGGLAHDFNNILTSILGNISLAKIDLESDDETYALLNDAEKASQRAQKLTHQLLTFSRGGSPIKTVEAIKPLIYETVNFALRGTNIKPKYIIPDNLLPLEIDAGQIGQVINNLTINAAQSMPDGGIFTVIADNIRIVDDSISLSNGSYVRISLIDTGIGISADIIGKIFDPYFTTKATGSGLGLTASYSIVKNHGGRIDVRSRENQKTVFDIYLPATTKKISEDSENVDKSLVKIGTGRILVMDDDEMICKVMGILLSKLGFQPEFAHDGKKTIELYRDALKSDEPFAAAIIDLTIPGGMGGLEAIRELRKIDPHIRAIVSSGYSNNPIMSRYKEHGFKGIAIKPYSIQSLSNTLRKILEK